MHAQRQTKERGSNLVEAALVIPLLVLFLVAAVDLGRVYFAYTTIIDGAREGARYGAAHYEDKDWDTKIREVVLAEAASQPILSLSPVNIAIENNQVQGSFVRVTVHVEFPLLLGRLVGRPTVPLGYAAAFRIRCDFGVGC
jgi:Flp pilus assembly protein TadG